MLREKETNNYIGILEAVTIKQVEMKEKNWKKSISGEWKKFSKPSSIAEIS